ncbi:class I SAM-dependent methyltransferase [Sporichthya sp.]|uniref:class I SAM-dependent methyltransferase n=1 Tax=Sporichthya sp. TaxID=65475 RepID=UPI0017D61929|nr:class I SAM-dependent methyltransferase [Sporichthya sp.]MBA3744698.1 class I SAM-dependent methyltransferase [Sporichthya sp.]
MTGATPSPNIWDSPEIYEIENRAVDPDRVIEAALAELVLESGQGLLGADSSWGRVLDVGCGNGFHLPRLAEVAEHVTGVEPRASLAAAAMHRTRHLNNVTIRQGLAQELPVPSASVDVAHARLAYFFGPGCEPGLEELARVVRGGGLAVVLDHDASRSELGRWFADGLLVDGVPRDGPAHERFWALQGFSRRQLDVRWQFENSADLAAVLRIEFPLETVQRALAEIGDRLELEAAVNLWFRRY